MNNTFTYIQQDTRYEFHWSECVDDDYMNEDSPLWDDDDYIPDEWLTFTHSSEEANNG